MLSSTWARVASIMPAAGLIAIEAHGAGLQAIGVAPQTPRAILCNFIYYWGCAPDPLVQACGLG